LIWDVGKIAKNKLIREEKTRELPHPYLLFGMIVLTQRKIFQRILPPDLQIPQ
jgi:hypothetical protein